ncbi:MAG: phosphatase PAP2 family protein [Cytophagales bacterium]|nr:MAG: phosphatase PAP2 family protein [Cytophagales bacterium]
MFHKIDKEATLLINSIHSDFFDVVMIFFSNKKVWIPLYIFLIILIIWKERKKVWLILISIALLILLSDQIASGILKPLVQRLRPCHEALMYPFLHLPDGCGGKYGFVSSHASNSFAIAIFLFLYFNKNKWSILLLLWATIVSYSRIYLGAHYLGDVVVGGLIGVLLGILVYKCYKIFYQKTFYSEKAL